MSVRFGMEKGRSRFAVPYTTNGELAKEGNQRPSISAGSDLRGKRATDGGAFAVLQAIARLNLDGFRHSKRFSFRTRKDGGARMRLPAVIFGVVLGLGVAPVAHAERDSMTGFMSSLLGGAI